MFAGAISRMSCLDLFGPIAGATNPIMQAITFQANTSLRTNCTPGPYFERLCVFPQKIKQPVLLDKISNGSD